MLRAKNKIVVISVLLAAFSVQANNTLPYTISERSVSIIFDAQYSESGNLHDFIEERFKLLLECRQSYIQQRSRGYAVRIQDNLYEFMNDLERITARIQGRPPPESSISRAEKLEALAEAQCRLYYKMGQLS